MLQNDGPAWWSERQQRKQEGNAEITKTVAVRIKEKRCKTDQQCGSGDTLLGEKHDVHHREHRGSTALGAMDRGMFIDRGTERAGGRRWKREEKARGMSSRARGRWAWDSKAGDRVG